MPILIDGLDAVTYCRVKEVVGAPSRHPSILGKAPHGSLRSPHCEHFAPPSSHRPFANAAACMPPGEKVTIELSTHGRGHSTTRSTTRLLAST
jgi:hypothetical protein